MSPILTSHEAKLLYSLIDAAVDDGLLSKSPLLPRWDELKRQSLKFRGEDRAALYHFTAEIEAAGLLENTWMLERWLSVKTRVKNRPLDSSPSLAPWVTPEKSL